MSKDHNYKDIERRLLLGASVTDQELRDARRLFATLKEDLSELGQRWHFPLNEAIRLENMCRQYIDARKEKMNW